MKLGTEMLYLQEVKNRLVTALLRAWGLGLLPSCHTRKFLVLHPDHLPEVPHFWTPFAEDVTVSFPMVLEK